MQAQSLAVSRRETICAYVHAPLPTYSRADRSQARRLYTAIMYGLKLAWRTVFYTFTIPRARIPDDVKCTNRLSLPRDGVEGMLNQDKPAVTVRAFHVHFLFHRK